MNILKHSWKIVAIVALLLGSVALGTVSAAPGFEWTVPMVADAGAEGSSSDLEFGIHTDATDGFDSGIDVPHPPPGPTPPPFDAYFSITDMLFPNLYKDFRAATPNNWMLEVKSTSNTIDLSWNCAAVPQGVNLRLINSGIDIDMKAQNSTILSAGSHTLTIVVTVEILTYTLTMAVDPPGSGTATDETGTGPYEEDEQVSIKAQAGAGYRFVNWTAPAGSFTDANAEETTFTMPGQDVTVTANFEAVPTYTLTMAVDPPGSGTATDETGTGPYEEDEQVSIKAQAGAGYRFVNWTAPAGAFANANAEETTFTMPGQDVTVTANFLAFSAPGNVDLVGADPGVESISVSSIDLDGVDTTNMPEDIEPQEAYIVDPTGTGSFTLRFTGVANASSIVIYKVVDSTWTQISPTAITVIPPTTIEVTMEVGDPIIVFAVLEGVPPPVGGTAHPINKLAILAPWIAIGAALVIGARLLILRRRRAQN